jgi:hypothetical protein
MTGPGGRARGAHRREADASGNRRGRRGRGGGGGTGAGADRGSLRTGLDRLPGWAPPLIFAVLTVFVFREFVFSGDMLFGSDTLALGYTARLFLAEALRTTGFPAWNPYILGGTPFLESLAGGDSLHPLSVALLLVMETHRALGWKLVIHVFLAGVFMFGWLRVLGVSRGGALVGGTAFLLAPYMVTLVFPGHDGKIFVTAMTPLLFWMGEWSWRRKDLLPPALLGLTVAVTVVSTHFQMAYFLFGAMGAYMLFRAIQVGREAGWKPAGRGFGLFLFFSILGAGAAGVQLLPALEYVTEHSRRAGVTLEAPPDEARAYAASWSLHPEEAVSLVVPEFAGSSVGGPAWASDTYWGRNPFKLNHEYLGVVALLLALAGLAAGGPRAGLRWFLVGIGAVMALFTLGAHTPVWRLFYEVLPGINLFRAPSMAIFIAGFAVATLAGMGVDGIATSTGDGEKRKRILQAVGAATGLILVGGLLAVSGILFEIWGWVFGAELGAREAAALDMARPHIVRGFFVAAFLGGAVTAVIYAVVHGVGGGLALGLILAGLVAVDQLRINEPFVRTMDPVRVTVPSPSERFLQERVREEPPFRVLSMVQGGEDVNPASFGVELAGGHHPNDLARYRELIGMEGGGIPEHLARFHPNVLRTLNVRYILWPDAQFGPLEGVEPVAQTRTAGGEVWTSVYPYPGLPRARVVGRAHVVPPGAAMERILDVEGFDPETETILEEQPPIPLSDQEINWSAEWIERTPNRLVLEVESSGPGLLVVGDNWFPAWRASVNGADVPILRADHTLRAVPLAGGGGHRVEMWYASPQLRRSLLVSVLSLLLLTGAALSAGIRDARDPARTREGGDGA